MHRVICDRFEQKGRALHGAELSRMIGMAKGWVLNEHHTQIRKIVPIPSSPAQLVQTSEQILRLGINDGHFPHKLEIDFEKQILQIQLYTPELSGLSYNDFALAFKIDGIQESLPKQK